MDTGTRENRLAFDVTHRLVLSIVVPFSICQSYRASLRRHLVVSTS
ncbi:hypothetical protein [Rhizobium yanglingense]